MHLGQRIPAGFSVVARHMTMRVIHSPFIMKLGLNALLPWSFGSTLYMWRLQREENLPSDRSNQTIIIHTRHVMGLYAGERASIYQLLHWVFVSIINEISNVLTNGSNDGCDMFTRDSQHLPTPTSACTVHNIYIQQGSLDTYPKYSIHERSNWIYLSFCNILQHLIFNFWAYTPFPILRLFFMLHKHRS